MFSAFIHNQKNISTQRKGETFNEFYDEIDNK